MNKSPEFFNSRLKSLAMATPRRIEEDQDIFVLVVYDFIEVISHKFAESVFEGFSGDALALEGECHSNQQQNGQNS